MALAKKYGIQKYSTPAGGCFLTGKEFAKKLRDLLEYKRKVTWDDVRLLRMGRHFRFRDNKVIVGRNEAENNLLLRYKQKNDYSFEVADFMGPITILQGKKSKASIEFAAALTLLYSDCKEESAVVKCGSKKIKASAVGREEANRYNLTL